MFKFNPGQNPKVRGSGHLILNGLRVFTISGFILVMAACWAMIVIAGMKGNFSFFDTMSHFFIFVISIFLVISELGLFKPYFTNNWPVLSPSHSLAWLGVAMVVIGCQIMSDMTKPAFSIDGLGLEAHRLVLAAGILAITFGFFNLLASLIFRDSPNGISTRMIRSDGNLAAPAHTKESYLGYPPDDFSLSRSGSLRHQMDEQEEARGFKRFTKFIPGFRKSRIEISRPMPHSQEHMPPMPASDVDLERSGSNYDDEDTLTDRRSPVMPGITRPDTALHPMHRHDRYGNDGYSVANVSRFTRSEYGDKPNMI